MSDALPTMTFVGTERFQPRAVVGRGSMGVVYRAFDADMDCDVALKTLDAIAPEGVYGLKQEFRTLTGITHPNLVALYDLVVGDGRCFFTMEYVDGVDFLTYVRASGGGPARLVEAARQLVAALSALHDAGKLHRDVKPTNVLVARDGRVVVLDFGLATALHGFDSPDDGFSGTLPYAAPEQIWGGPRDVAADWYAVGTLLYEALAGVLPFTGHWAEVAVAKTERPRPPSAHGADVPPPLETLVLDLLDPDPARRPPAREIAARLRVTMESGPVVVASPASPSHAGVLFVGREAELLRLRTAFDAMDDGKPRVVEVSGPSGIGKTELVRRFVDEVAATGAVVLRGRCHPQEAVPYNALDGVVDALSVYLASEPDHGSGLVPRHAASLVTVFPVLARLAAFRDLAPPDAEPYEIRRRAIDALRDLLGAFAAARRVVVWVDDTQWGDADSAMLVQELLRGPDAPPILLLLSTRGDDGSALSTTVTTVVAPERMIVGPLDAAASRTLAQRLVVASGARGPSLDDVVDDAAGSPFMIAQLSLATPREGAPRLRIADVLSDRLGDLGPEARDLLDVMALAGGPLERLVALDAAGIGRRGRPLAYGLERTRLLRPTIVHADAGIEIYHDRIRQAVLDALDGDRRRALHGRIADAIRRTPAPDPQALFTHYLGAGDAGLAATYAELAADRAAEALAVDRAAGMYASALELGSRPDVSVLHRKRADALANAGRSADAAPEYEAAAATLGKGHDVLELQRRAAEQYLRAGRLMEGVDGTKRVLAALGIPFADSPTRALAQVVFQRARRAWRARRFERRGPPPSDGARTRLDALWGATVTLGTVDQVVADVLGVRHFIEAFEHGDPVHGARAMGLEAAKSAQIGGARQRRRAARMLADMAHVVADGGQPYERAYLEIVSGVCAYQTARWREAFDRCQAGNAILREHCVGVSWELATGDAFALSALAHMGELRALSERLPAAIRDAEEHGDFYASVGFRSGVLNLVWLAQDRPDEARRQTDEAIARWPGTRGFNVQHYLHLIASVHIDLYVGDPWTAWQRILTAWPKARAALLLLMEAPRVELRFLRARVALACAASAAAAEEATTPDPRWPAHRLLRVAEAAAARIARDRALRSAPALSAAIRAGVARMRGDVTAAARLYEDAALAFGDVHMRLHAAAATAATPRGSRAADEYLTSQGFPVPERLLRVLCP
jgi:hypothetical protein